jgi:hypothetical protein
MGKTAMQILLDHFEKSDALVVTNHRLIEVIKNHIQLESYQIANAYDSAKNYPSNDCDGNKYYFMTYISND